MASKTRRGAPPTRSRKLGVQYTRYSTVDQGSTPEQVAINEELATDAGVTIVRHFMDEGLSRSLSERPGLRELFAYLESHPEVGYIVVNELERMTAGVDQRQEITALCKRHRITIIEDTGEIDPHDEEAMHKADERAVSAKGEVLKVQRRTRRNLRAKVKGGRVAMRPPYGVRMKPLVTLDGVTLPSGVSMLDSRGRKMTSGEIERHPDEHPWLVKIFEWAVEGKSLNEICRRLMEEGVPTKTGRTRWDSTTIRGILDNRLYRGELTWGRRKTLRDEHGKSYQEFRDDDDAGTVSLPSPLGALIDPAIWDRVQEIKITKGTARSVELRKAVPQPLDQRVFCDRCGHKMYMRWQQNSDHVVWRFLCLSSYGSMANAPIEGFQDRCNVGHSISQKELYKVLTSLDEGNEKAIVTIVEGPTEDPSTRQRKLKAKITKAEEEFTRAKRLAVKGLITDDDLAQAKRETDETIEQTEAELDALELGAQPAQPVTEEVRGFLAELAAELQDESMPIETRTKLLDRAGLDRIYVDKPRLGEPLLRLQFSEAAALL